MGLVALEGAVPVPLGALSDDAAQELLMRRLGPARVAADPGPVRTVIEACEGLPLALGLAAAWAATHPELPIAAFATSAGTADTVFEAMDGGDPHADLRAGDAAATVPRPDREGNEPSCDSHYRHATDADSVRGLGRFDTVLAPGSSPAITYILGTPNSYRIAYQQADHVIRMVDYSSLLNYSSGGVVTTGLALAQASSPAWAAVTSTTR